MTLFTRRQILVLAAIGLLTFAPPVFAYLDPSTGSMILSAIVGLFATMALAIKTYWYRLKAFFRGERSDRKSPDKQEPAGDGQPTDN